VADDGVLQIDHAWLALNPDGFRYGRGGRSMRAPSAGAFTRDVPGFVTRYATSALEEDKAELFAFMLTEPAAVASLAESDAVLARKVARMKQLVVELSADAGEGFWLRVDRFRAR
jgi:hypothetical protein